jgi:hypothetical protein
MDFCAGTPKGGVALDFRNEIINNFIKSHLGSPPFTPSRLSRIAYVLGAMGGLTHGNSLPFPLVSELHKSRHDVSAADRDALADYFSSFLSHPEPINGTKPYTFMQDELSVYLSKVGKEAEDDGNAEEEIEEAEGGEVEGGEVEDWQVFDDEVVELVDEGVLTF